MRNKQLLDRKPSSLHSRHGVTIAVLAGCALLAAAALAQPADTSNWNARYRYPNDAINSKARTELKVRPGGKTKTAHAVGLTFRTKCTLTWLKDGTVLASAAGIEAEDESKNFWASTKVVDPATGKEAIIFAPKGAAPPYRSVEDSSAKTSKPGSPEVPPTKPLMDRPVEGAAASPKATGAQPPAANSSVPTSPQTTPSTGQGWTQQDTLNWNGPARTNVESAERLKETDAVSAYLLLRELHVAKVSQVTAAQRMWLEGSMMQLRPKAFVILQRDYDAAMTSRNYRDIVYATFIADLVEKGRLKRTMLREAEIENEIYSQKSTVPQTWKISNVTTSKGDDPVIFATSAGPLRGNNFQQLQTQAGFHLLVVKATVTNVSNTSDLPYLVNILPISVGRSGDLTVPFRWMHDSFINIVTPTSEKIPVGFVRFHEGVRIPMQDGKEANVPIDMKTGASIDFIAVFSVPSGINEFRLLVIGAAPVPLTIES